MNEMLGQKEHRTYKEDSSQKHEGIYKPTDDNSSGAFDRERPHYSGHNSGHKKDDDKTRYRQRTRLPFRKKFCFFTRNHITYIDYKDTLLLKRFLGRSGQILSPRITGVKPIYQRKLALAVKRARYMAFIPYVGEVTREDIPHYYRNTPENLNYGPPNEERSKYSESKPYRNNLNNSNTFKTTNPTPKPNSPSYNPPSNEEPANSPEKPRENSPNKELST